MLSRIRTVAPLPLLLAAVLLIPGPFGWSAWTDTDSDSYPDLWTSADGTVTLSLLGATAGNNSDADSLTDEQEATADTDPYSTDTDLDGLDDGFEVTVVIPSMGNGWSASLWDSDGDGYSDYDEWYVSQGLSGITTFTGIYYGSSLPGFSGSTWSDYDGDGIKNPHDPAPENPDNYSSANNTNWYAQAFADDDNDSVLNFYDAWPNDSTNGGTADSDGDGFPDSTDPAPSDGSNYSPANYIYWYGDALGDSDGDGANNFNDGWPNDAANGVPNSDNDAYLDDVDPALSDSTNYSSANQTSWYSNALGDDDNDGTNNFNDPWPTDPLNGSGGGGGADSDGDGYADETDPAPSDYWNYSYVNNIQWAGNLFGDADSDGSLNFWDALPYDTPPPPLDSDGDGLLDDDEVALGTDVNVMDTDDDGLTDYEEVQVTQSNPLNKYSVAHSKGWGSYYTDWQMLCSDGDGDQIPDRIEDHYGLNKNSAADGWGDLDADGICNRAQFLDGIPLTANLSTYDTDGDGLFDTYEDFYLLDEADFTDGVTDPDGDGLMNFEEAALSLATDTPSSQGGGTSDSDLFAALGHPQGTVLVRVSPGDVDGDNLPDVWEHRYRNVGVPQEGTRIRIPDAAADPDGDTLSNWVEFKIGTNPTRLDTDTSDSISNDSQLDSDGDGLTNAEEAAAGTHAWAKDSDGDGIDDAAEIAEGTDPMNAASNLPALLGLRVTTPLVAAN